LTFGTGSFIALKIYWNSQENLSVSTNAVSLNSYSKKLDFRKSFVKYYDSSQEQKIQTEKATEPFCNDKRILQVWKTLVKDRDFQEWQPNSRESLDCKDMLEIKEFDLNQDGNKEILLRGQNFNLCSAVGNCGFWIYEKKGNKFKKILYSTDYIDVSESGKQVKRNKTKGYFDILLKGHITAADTNYLTYKFDGKKYQQKNCLVHTYVRGTTPNPKWEFISCGQFYKRWENER